MRRSIFLKIFGGYILITVLLAVLFVFFSFRAIRSFHLDQLAANLTKIGNTLKLEVMSYLENQQLWELDAFVKSFGQEISTRITVINQDGMVLADSDEDPETMANHRFRPEIARAFSGQVGRSLRFSNTVKERMLYIGLPIEEAEKIPYVLRLSLYIRDIDPLLTHLRSDLLKIITIVALVSMLGAFLFARSLTKPIKILSHASRRLASGDFNTKITLTGRSELKDLADSFNDMAGRLKSLFEEQSRQKEELDSILGSIEEGLLALDKEGRILTSNASMRSILQSDSLDGKFYWEVVRNPKFHELVERVREEKSSRSEELMIIQRVFLCSANPLPTKDEILVTFYDMTKIKDVEKIKRDFIANASHELRTPLTAIKGYVETLEEEVGDKGRDYLEIIKRNTERLTNLVNDLLLLSELEEMPFDMEMETVNLEHLIENICKIFVPQVKAKNLKLETRTEKNLPPVWGDSYRLEQMFINILDNAVRHTERGTITVSLSEKEGTISVEIRDTGIGIPEEHLLRIFERFYVVDKSRARRLGGTGLGLSIVKHIALLHHGEVKVDSTPGEGTVFTVQLPISSKAS